MAVNMTQKGLKSTWVLWPSPLRILFAFNSTLIERYTEQDLTQPVTLRSADRQSISRQERPARWVKPPNNWYWLPELCMLSLDGIISVTYD